MTTRTLLYDTADTDFATILQDLPKKGIANSELYLYEGFWYFPAHLEALLAAKSHFQACPDDVFLASSMKTGTTWMKALISCIMHEFNDGNDPLDTNHPHALLPTLEVQVYRGNPSPDLSNMTNPRLFATHCPYSILPESIKSNSNCKIVYIARNAKDTFVSMWHFMNNVREGLTFPIDEVFNLHGEGIHAFGPFFDHVLEYWNESVKNPKKILFMKYEEMKKDPKGEVKKLASFLGKPFKDDEEVDKVLWRCSLDRLKSLEVNKNGVETWAGLPKSSYFRKGAVGDWRNYLTDEMSERFDSISKTKLEGSGLVLV